MGDSQQLDLVGRITEDIASHASFDPHEALIGDDFAEAYRIQDLVAEELVRRAIRGPVCGYKIAVNSSAQMAQLGLEEPISARLFTDQRHDSGAALHRTDYRTLLIEPEILAVLNQPIKGGGHDRQSIKQAVSGLRPAFELVDLRDGKLGTFKLTAGIAQNISNEGVVIGGPGLAPDDLDVETLPVTVSFDGETIHEATGAAPEHPLDALAWLANHLAARGKALDAGMIVLCGTHMPMKAIGETRHVAADFGPLGDVAFTIS